MIHPHYKHRSITTKPISLHSSVSLFSQALLMLLAVSLTVVCGVFSKLFVNEFVVCDLFFHHSVGVSLASVL